LLLAAFVLLGVLAASGPIGPDATVAGALRGEWRRPPGTVAAMVSVLLGPIIPVAAAVLLLIGVAVAYRRADRWLLRVLIRCFVVGVACRLVSVLKPAFDRRRPRLYPDFSYPSGHVVSVATTAFVAILLCLWLAQRLLPLVTTVAVLAVLVCAAARVVLGVHWVTDTVGAALGVTGVGLLVAGVLGLLPVTARQRVEAPRTPRAPKTPDASAVE
jgi:membrane-associated phospholipid phosphatase